MVTTHCRLAAELKWRAVCMEGRATFTMVESSTTINCARANMPRASPLLLVSSAETGASRLGASEKHLACPRWGRQMIMLPPLLRCALVSVGLSHHEMPLGASLIDDRPRGRRWRRVRNEHSGKS